MAKQESFITLKGTLGGLTFYKSSLDGYLVKTPGGVSKERIMSDAAFIRTRENGQEFGIAASAGKLLRQSVHDILKNSKDKRVTSRLTKNMLAVSHTDTTSVRGQRNPESGDLTMLNNFDFNNNAKLPVIFKAPYAYTVDRVAGTVTLSIPAFTPNDAISIPEGATHYQIVAAASEIDFANKTYNTDSSATATLPLDGTPSTPLNDVLSLTAGTTLPLFVYLQVIFYQQVNGVAYSLKNGAYNTMAIIDVNP